MKKILPIILLVISMSSFSQERIETGNNNPKLKGSTLITRVRQAIPDGDKLYLGGNIQFVNDQITSPIIRLNADGSLDESFHYDGIYSIGFDNALTGPATLLNGSLIVTGEDGIEKLNEDGSIDETFTLANSNFVNDMIAYKDSLLVLSAAANLDLYNEDGTFRTIETGLAGQYWLQALVLLSENTLLIQCQDRNTGEFKYFQFKDHLILDDSFTPFEVDQPGNIHHIELLSSGKIFVSGKKLTVNETSGNGIYLVDETGAIDAGSPHNADLSFIDVYDSGIDFAIPLSNGKIMVLGHTDNSNFANMSVGRLLDNGSRDDLFSIKTFEVDDLNNRKLLRDLNGDLFLIHAQNSYDGQEARGINKIDADGNNIDSYSVDLFGKPDFFQMTNYDSDKFIITGSFIESNLSTTPLITGFSYNANVTFPWLDMLDVAHNDLMGNVKVLSNGDIYVGVYDQSEGRVIHVYNQDGTRVDLSSSHVSPIFVQRSVFDVHESDTHIYTTGLFAYTANMQTKRQVLKMNKDYSIDSDYNPSSEILSNDIIAFSHLTDDDRLIVQHYNSSNSTSNIIRLLPNGDKDTSFNDIAISDVSFGNAPVFMVSDSLLMLYESDFNNPQTLKMYDLNGSLLDGDLATISADGGITNIIQVSDSTLLVSGSFSSINNIAKQGIALVNFNGAVYDDLDLDVTGSVDVMEIYNDTLYLLGPGGINDHVGAGFYAYDYGPNPVEIETISTTETGKIQLAWKEDPSLRNIEIRRIDPQNNEISLASFDDGTTSFTDETSEVNILYDYKLISKNLLGESQTTIPYEVIKPNAPESLSVQFSGGDNLLSWTDASDKESGFQVYRSLDGGDFSMIAQTDANVVSYLDEDIEVDHDFSYFLVAPSSNFQSDPSDTIEISIFRPDSPVNPSFELTSENDILSVTLSWESSDAETDDFIILESTDNVNFESIDTVGVSITTFVRAVEADNIYYYYILSRSEVGNSDPSATLEVNTFRPDAPDNLLFDFDNEGTVSLSWSASSLADSYIIYESMDNATFNPIDTVDNSTLTYDRMVPVTDINYYFYIVAHNVVGNSEPSASIEVSTTILGLDPDHFNHVIYPNPSFGEVRIKLKSREVKLITISDINGRVLQKLPAENNELIVRNLSAGIYFFNFVSDSAVTEIQKIIVR